MTSEQQDTWIVSTWFLCVRAILASKIASREESVLLALIVTAQAAVETGYGQHRNGGRNSLWNMKGGSATSGTRRVTKEYRDGVGYIHEVAIFRDYETIDDAAVDAASWWLRRMTRAKMRDARASAIVAAFGPKYATEPAYVSMLTSMLQRVYHVVISQSNSQ